MFSGGKWGHCPPFLARLFSTDQKRGRGFDPPPNIWSCNRNLVANVPKNATKRHKTPQNATTYHKTPQNATKRLKTPQNATKRHKTPQNAAKCCIMLHNAAKHHKTLQNAVKRRKLPQTCPRLLPVCHKTPQNTAKCRKYCKLAISLCGTKYLGGLKNPTPFSGLLKLIMDHNWGATVPFPPENNVSSFFQKS